MGDYEFRDNLVTLARFGTPAEAVIAQARLQEEGIDTSLVESHAATVFNHAGADLVGPKLLVRQGDLQKARDVLDDVLEHDNDEEELDDYDATDWTGEDWVDDEDEEYSEEALETPPLTRAFRSAVIGAIALPLLVLNLHSMVLIFRHRLWEPQPGESNANWRFYLALVFNAIGVFIFWVIFRSFRE